MLNTWISYINPIDALLIIITFCTTLFYVYNLNEGSKFSLKHIYTINLGLIPFIFLILFIYSLLIPYSYETIGYQLKLFKQVLISDYYGLFFKQNLFLFLLALSFKAYYFKIKTDLVLDAGLILIFFCLFASLLLSTFDLGFAFLCIEGISLSTYILIAIPMNIVSIEAATKYIWFSIYSSALMILSIFFFFFVVKDLNFYKLSITVYECFNGIGYNFSSNVLIKSGIILFILSFFIKLAAFPAHFWSLDVYEGSWSPTTSILMVCVKLVFVFFFIRVVVCVFYSAYSLWYSIFLLSIFGCFFYGSFGAIRQSILKRILAFTSISQTGFLFLGLICGNIQGISGSIFHIYIYMLSLLAFFLLLFLLTNLTGKEMVYITDFINLGKERPFFALGFTVIFLSMAGIPPFFGFFTKYIILVSLINTQHYFLLITSIFFSIITSFVYFRFVKIMWFEKLKTIKPKIKILKTNLDYILISSIIFIIFILISFLFSPEFYLDWLISVVNSLIHHIQ